MKRVTWITCALAAGAIAACGSADAETANAGGTSSKPAPSGQASAEQVAKEMRGKVKCPARVVTARQAGAPVDDVVGVRPLMPWEEAANLILCDRDLLVITENAGRGYNINTYGQHIRQGFDAKFAEPRVVKTSEQVLSDIAEQAMRRSANARVVPLEPGQVRYFVSTMGLPGQEQVISVAREEYYEEGKLPTVASVRQALIEKYGEQTQVDDNGIITTLYWEYDPAGARIEPSDWRAVNCRISVSPDVGTSLSGDCGITVGAQIQGARDNPGLAHSLAVTSQHGAEGYALLQRTEAALRQADETRQAEELGTAAKNADKPKL